MSFCNLYTRRTYDSLYLFNKTIIFDLDLPSEIISIFVLRLIF